MIIKTRCLAIAIESRGFYAQQRNFKFQTAWKCGRLKLFNFRSLELNGLYSDLVQFSKIETSFWNMNFSISTHIDL